MPHSEICVIFTPFIEFLTLYKEAILDAPYDGHVDTIRVIFREFCADVPAKEKTESRILFLKFLADFNVITGHALVFSAESDDKLVWVKVANVLLLKSRLEEAEPEVTKSINYIGTEISQLPYSALGNKNVKKQLIEILDSDPHTVILCEAPLERGFDRDICKLEKVLAKPSAMIVLGIRRAQLRTTQKPFYEVCEETNHSQTIANLCLNLKSTGLGFHELPTNARIHKVISSCKSLLNKEVVACAQSKIHFLPLLTNNTDLYLGNCSYLDTCHKLKNCRYLHYYTLNPTEARAEPSQQRAILSLDYTIGECHDTILRKETPAQWINCDVRYLPFKVLGKFAAIISDPAWDIHMSLPYGTCKDSELLSLPMRELQDEGVLMLWVTGRSIEIGRKALDQWGYTVSDEMIWIKLNQLRKTIVTGRTGHWLNHSKEHLLVGVKGNPIWLNRKIDIDFIVSGTRETLRKPDELYGIVDRLVGMHARKLEIFGRDNNIRPGWISTYKHSEIYLSFKFTNRTAIGNQLTGTYIYEEEVKQKYNKYQASAKKT